MEEDIYNTYIIYIITYSVIFSKKYNFILLHKIVGIVLLF